MTKRWPTGPRSRKKARRWPTSPSQSQAGRWPAKESVGLHNILRSRGEKELSLCPSGNGHEENLLTASGSSLFMCYLVPVPFWDTQCR